jgi:transposase
MPRNIILSQLLSLKKTRVIGYEFLPLGLMLDVKTTFRHGRCSGCGHRCRRVKDRNPGRVWRHLDFAGMRVTLRSSLRRLDCPRCGVLVEWVPWAATGSDFTLRFEEQVAFLAQHANKTVVSEMLGIAWRTVGSVIERVLARLGPRDLLAGLRRIGVDELSYRRHHEYITIVVDHDTGRIVWARPGRNADTLKAFFIELGTERCAALENVSIDMSQSYIEAVKEKAPNAQIVFDRFHVQRLAHDALDEVRRQEVAKAGGPATDRGNVFKHTRWALQKNPWNLTAVETGRLSFLQRANKPLYRGYLLKESLAAILDRRQHKVARVKLDEWCAWARRSRLAPFAKVGRTIKRHLDGVVAYVATGLSNGRVEGLNGKARTLTRRAYGFHNAHSLIAMLFLCCSGITLHPVRVLPEPEARETHPL